MPSSNRSGPRPKTRRPLPRRRRRFSNGGWGPGLVPRGRYLAAGFSWCTVTRVSTRWARADRQRLSTLRRRLPCVRDHSLARFGPDKFSPEAALRYTHALLERLHLSLQCRLPDRHRGRRRSRLRGHVVQRDVLRGQPTLRAEIEHWSLLRHQDLFVRQ
jgi:hypothetical protein